MSTARQPEQPAMPGLDKAVVLLMALEPTQCANVLRLIPEDAVDALTARMAGMEKVPSTKVEDVLHDAAEAAAGQTAQLSGSLEGVREIVTAAFGPERATRMMDRLSKSLNETDGAFGTIRKVEPQQLAKFVLDEHPQSIAIVVAHLDPSQAAGLLAALPADLRVSVARRVASLGRVSPESIRMVATALRQKLKNLGDFGREVSGGVRTVADIFNRFEADACGEILEALGKVDPALSENVRRLMFVFEDLLTVDKAAITELVQRVDRPTLVTALKGSSEDLRRYVMSCMAARAAGLLKDDIEVSGPVKLKAVDDAQQEIIATARELEQQGVITLKSGGADYVQ
jgi:flagellar motor switch protein FliG